ncbi:MAG TPA: hypothetical protein VHG51_13965 [Longimicrobiaceae bacterium]|nr:hypothetical protein [Longimicrobiaceae bacterium]
MRRGTTAILSGSVLLGSTLLVGLLFGTIEMVFACCGQAHPPAPGSVGPAFLHGLGVGALVGAMLGLPLALLSALAVWIVSRRRGVRGGG